MLKIQKQSRPSKGGFPAELDKVRASLPRGIPIEIWFQDEARIGQKNKITRRWAKRGSRPSAPHDQRTKSAYIFGAICPQEGKAAGLVLPFCNTDTMNLHLAEISVNAAPAPTPCCSWTRPLAPDAEARVASQHLYDEIVDHCCDAWNKLVEQPWRIMSLGLREWAQEF